MKVLLVDYYNPMYNYQIQKKQGMAVYKGYADAVLSYLNDQFIY
ncbi:Selenophosphate-dependent tRNA 2-selenouridine synthase [hydrothermal vent metagenome]|uniref:Selenophosphate-dependent tRNA 2-selenouridine synthase n=1 Tax=hydrothermal vent metagenome TaxID=652676 RepID=A0A1W1DY88_9ZZZZ